jgi:hypothetical protein
LNCAYSRLLIQNPKIDDQKKREVLNLFRKAKQYDQEMTFALDKRMIVDISSLSISALHIMVAHATRWFEKCDDFKMIFSCIQDVTEVMMLLFMFSEETI